MTEAVKATETAGETTGETAGVLVAGERAVPDPSGALRLPAHDALLVADLHFEKGSAFAARGQLLPPYDTAATLQRLAELIAAHRPARLICLGDSFHDLGADGRMAESDVETLQGLVASVQDWIWIEGNHDPVPPPRFGGRTAPELRLGALTLRHEPTEGPAEGELAGHLHPAAKVRGRGRSVRRRCFATDGARMILPAFGAYAGGLNVRDEAFARCFGRTPDALVMGSGQVWPVKASKLAPDRAGR